MKVVRTITIDKALDTAIKIGAMAWVYKAFFRGKV
jgi:hypothetical protein